MVATEGRRNRDGMRKRRLKISGPSYFFVFFFSAACIISLSAFVPHPLFFIIYYRSSPVCRVGDCSCSYLYLRSFASFQLLAMFLLIRGLSTEKRETFSICPATRLNNPSALLEVSLNYTLLWFHPVAVVLCSKKYADPQKSITMRHVGLLNWWLN